MNTDFGDKEERNTGARNCKGHVRTKPIVVDGNCGSFLLAPEASTECQHAAVHKTVKRCQT